MITGNTDSKNEAKKLVTRTSKAPLEPQHSLDWGKPHHIQCAQLTNIYSIKTKILYIFRSLNGFE